MNEWLSVRPSVCPLVCLPDNSKLNCCLLPHIETHRSESHQFHIVTHAAKNKTRKGWVPEGEGKGWEQGAEGACTVEGQTNKKTTTAIHTQTAVTGMKWHYCYLNAASECFSSGVGPRQSGWHSRSRSRSAVARQLPHGSCHLAVVGCRLPNCQVESRFPHVRTGKGNGNSKGNGNYTKDVLK